MLKSRIISNFSSQGNYHRLQTPRAEIAFTVRPKIHSHFQVLAMAEAFLVCHIGPFFQIITFVLASDNILVALTQKIESGPWFEHLKLWRISVLSVFKVSLNIIGKCWLYEKGELAHMELINAIFISRSETSSNLICYITLKDWFCIKKFGLGLRPKTFSMVLL